MESFSPSMAVFKEVCEIVIDGEFSAAQTDFISANYKAFEDTEENKLEYTQIHGDYLHIMEQIIETQLKAKFPETQIDEFYADFK